MSNKGHVYFNSCLAGIITETDSGYSYVYDPKYITQADAKPVSLTLPVREEPFESPTLFAFFDGLIPEGWLLDIAVDHWKVKINDRFQLLLLSCRDTIGAVTVIPVNENETTTE